MIPDVNPVLSPAFPVLCSGSIGPVRIWEAEVGDVYPVVVDQFLDLTVQLVTHLGPFLLAFFAYQDFAIASVSPILMVDHGLFLPER